MKNPLKTPRVSALRLLPLLAMALPALSAAPASARITVPEEGFGIGFVLGAPTGLSGSLPIGDANAFNAVVGYNLSGGTNLHLQADYVWILKEIIPVDQGAVSAYFGPGAFALLARDAAVGLRFVGGMDYRFAAAPVQVFLEIAPGISLLPNTDPHLGAGLGARYYF